MKLDKLTEATMLALRGKLNEVYIKQDVETFDELYDSCWGPAIEVLDKIAENNLEGELMNWLEDLYTEGEPIDITGLNDFIIFSAEDIYRALGLDENGDSLDESKKLRARNKKYENRKQEARNYIEVKKYKFDGTDTFPKRIKARGGYTFTKVDDGKSENAFIPVYRNESGDETLMLQDDFDNCEILEARSHKEDNEKASPRTITKYGREMRATDTQKDLDNTFVGKRYAKGAVANNPYYGGQYYGTTDAEYRSKRNKTGQKRTSTIDMSKKYDVYKADTFETPVTNYQSAMNRYKSYEETGDEDMPIAQSYKNSAQDIVNKERERIANKKATEARSHKEDNERVAPRGNISRERGYIKHPEEADNLYYYSKVDLPKRAVFHKGEPYENGKVWGIYDRDEAETYEKSTPDIERYKELKGNAEAERDEADIHNRRAKQNDDMASDIIRNKKSARAQGMLKGKEVSKKESKKVTEATTDVNEVYEDYKKAYGKDLDLKTVPCVIARDKMLSGWGGAEGKIHYQVVLCADSTEAHNIGYKMQAEAKKEQLANVRVSFGVKIPRGGSVAYCVGRYATAWNMGDSWYERYDKKVENKSIKIENVQGNNQGICPKCGSMITNYGEIFWDDEGIGQVFDCTNPECKAHGIEYYNTTFDYIEVEEN